MLFMINSDYFTTITTAAPKTPWLVSGITIKTTTTG
jgi:hypothetical protein